MRAERKKSFLASTVLAAAALAAAANPGTAQSGLQSSACGEDPAIWIDVGEARLEGEWQVSMGPGTLTMAGRTLALPDPGDVSLARIGYQDGTLFISGGPVPDGEWELRAWHDGLNFDLPGDGLLQSGDVAENADISSAAGCAVNDLPQLQGGGAIEDPEGKVSTDLYLVVLTDFWIYGVTIETLNGGQGIARRVFEMRR